ANARRALQLHGCVVEGIVELPGELAADHDEETAAEKHEDGAERREVPCLETEPEPSERLQSHRVLLGETVAGAAEGMNQLRLEPIVDLPPQAPNEDLEHVRERV